MAVDEAAPVRILAPIVASAEAATAAPAMRRPHVKENQGSSHKPNEEDGRERQQTGQQNGPDESAHACRDERGVRVRMCLGYSTYERREVRCLCV